MKHLPNILTLCNLMCGCIATVYILHSQPFIHEENGVSYWITGTTQAYMGAMFIMLAAIFDLFDGMVARWLGVFSPIGKDLDSLADVISFGVAPSAILFKMLWAAYMSKQGAIDVPMSYMIPAFLPTCFAALRLAKFNISTSQTKYFTGVPVPAMGIVVASFPLINFYNTWGIGSLMHNEWLIFAIIALLCWLMVSPYNFFTFKMSSLNMQQNAAQIIWLILSIVAVFIFQYLAVPISFLLYIILSFIFKKQIQ